MKSQVILLEKGYETKQDLEKKCDLISTRLKDSDQSVSSLKDEVSIYKARFYTLFNCLLRQKYNKYV